MRFKAIFGCVLGAGLLAQEPVPNPAPPVAASQVVPPAAPWPAEMAGRALYSIKAGAKTPAALILREADGTERVLMEGNTFLGKQEDLPQQFGQFAIDRDGETVFFAGYGLQVVQQPTMTPLILVPGAGILATALGNALGNAIGHAMMGGSGDAGPVSRYFLGLYVWRRSTGKVETLWKGRELNAALKSGSTGVQVPGAASFDLISDLRLALPSQFIHLTGSQFLMVTSQAVVRVDVVNKTLVPESLGMNSQAAKAPEILQDGTGRLVIRQGEHLFDVKPDGSFRKANLTADVFRYTSLSADTWLETDGKSVRVFEVEWPAVKEVGSFQVKNTKLLRGGSDYCFAYRFAGSGFTLAKVSLTGKVLWTVKVGDSHEGLTLSEKDGLVHLMVARRSLRSEFPYIPYRMVLDAQTGAIKDQDNWYRVPGKQTGPIRKLPIDPFVVARVTGGVLPGESHHWFHPATQFAPEAFKPQPTWRNWVPAADAVSDALDPMVGSWVKINPDFTVESLGARDMAEQMITVTPEGRVVYYSAAVQWMPTPATTPTPAQAPAAGGH